MPPARHVVLQPLGTEFEEALAAQVGRLLYPKARLPALPRRAHTVPRTHAVAPLPPGMSAGTSVTISTILAVCTGLVRRSHTATTHVQWSWRGECTSGVTMYIITYGRVRACAQEVPVELVLASPLETSYTTLTRGSPSQYHTHRRFMYP